MILMNVNNEIPTSLADSNIEHDVRDDANDMINPPSTSESSTSQPQGLVLPNPPLIRSSRIKRIPARFKDFVLDSP